MFCSIPAADKERAVTARDGATLAHLYRDDIKIAHHFHETGDATDKFSLNNEGVNYASAQQFAKAAERFEAALKIDPKYEPAKQNLSACLNNLAITMAKSGKYAEAAPRFKRAIDLQQNAKDHEKLVTTMKNYAFVLHKLNRFAEAQTVKAAAEKIAASSAAVTSKK
jgi:tetratricopeptide (TPR) repeat protein